MLQGTSTKADSETPNVAVHRYTPVSANPVGQPNPDVPNWTVIVLVPLMLDGVLPDT